MGDHYDDSLTLGREYGGQYAADGYSTDFDTGYEKIIDCNSALGLIGLLGLIELLRDMLEKMTVKEEMRKRRSLSGLAFGIFQTFLGDGRSSSLRQTLPAVLIPLLHNMVDVNDGFEDPACLERSLCEANRVLHQEESNYSFVEGTASGIVASLLSQVAAKSFTDYNPKRYLVALKAAEAGRNGADCGAAFPKCSYLRPHHMPLSNTNFTDRVLRRMAGDQHV